MQCPTCLEVFTPEDNLQCPPCGHVFHGACIRQWLRSKRGSNTGPDCPQCRKPTDLKSLMKIYLAEADGGDSLALEERRKNLVTHVEEIHEKLEIKEGENESLSDRVGELTINLKEKTTKFKNKINRIRKDKKVLRQKLNKFESKREEESEKFKDKQRKVAKKGWKDAEKRPMALKQKLKGNRQKSKIPCENNLRITKSMLKIYRK